MDKWNLEKIGSLISYKKGFAFKSSSYKDQGLLIVRVSDTTNDSINIATCLRICENEAKSYSDYIIKTNDIIIATVGSWPDNPNSIVGKVVRVPQKANGALLNQNAVRIRGNSHIDQNYLYYRLKNSDFSSYLINNAQGSANQASITLNDIFSFEIKLPSFSEQKAIASVLSSLDDKIDLLHRQNKTLEAMAETLFRQWFKDQDTNGTISQIISIQNGYAFKSNDFNGCGNHGIIKIKNISDGIVDIENTDFISETVAKNINQSFQIVNGDILIAMTGAEIGKLGIVPKTNKSLFLNQRVGLIKEKYQGAKYLAYLQLKSDFGQDYIENTATGSAQPNISSSGIENCGFPKLTENEIASYCSILDEIYEKIIYNLGHIQTLNQLRDTLLPKLMSGEIRVKMD